MGSSMAFKSGMEARVGSRCCGGLWKTRGRCGAPPAARCRGGALPAARCRDGAPMAGQMQWRELHEGRGAALSCGRKRGGRPPPPCDASAASRDGDGWTTAGAVTARPRRDAGRPSHGELRDATASASMAQPRRDAGRPSHGEMRGGPGHGELGDSPAAAFFLFRSLVVLSTLQFSSFLYSHYKVVHRDVRG
jgi:hypothetical protein